MRSALILITCLITVSALGAPPMPIETALEILHGQDILRMEDAVEALVARGSESIQYLLPLLGDDAPRDARASAIEALGRIGDPGALSPLQDQLLRLGPTASPSDSFARRYLRTETVIALGQLGMSECGDLLQQVAQGGDPFDRVHALTALVRIGRTEIMPQLLEHLDPDQDPALRSLTVRGLGLIGGEEVREPLLRALRDPKWFVRDGAAEVLGRQGHRQAVEELQRLVRSDPSAFVQRTAQEALQRLGERP